MAKDILSMYGPDSPANQKAKATSGGCTTAKPLPYCPPQGPMGQMHKGVGLGGSNFGNCGSQQASSLHTSEGGSPGNHGENHGMGTNRKG